MFHDPILGARLVLWVSSGQTAPNSEEAPEAVVVRGPPDIDSFIPMFMFAILFGLSMDYEVFLLSRVREEYTRTGHILIARNA